MSCLKKGYIVINGFVIEASISPDKVEEKIGDICEFHNIYTDVDRETFEFHDISVLDSTFDVILDYENGNLYRIYLSKNYKTENVAEAHNVLFTEDRLWLESQLGKPVKSIETRNVPIIKEKYVYPYRTHVVSLNWVYDIRTNIYDVFVEIRFRSNTVDANNKKL